VEAGGGVPVPDQDLWAEAGVKRMGPQGMVGGRRDGEGYGTRAGGRDTEVGKRETRGSGRMQRGGGEGHVIKGRG
jgi:hypothetical protein